MKHFKNHFFICSVIILFSAATVFSQGYLKTSGTSIVDENGSNVLLRGIGLGGWLVPEGYMLQTSSFA
ncbi:MAG: glycosyl hydrolase family 5, partial [Ignavibacteriae bacterium HGW-Ignavibacteriae-3]